MTDYISREAAIKAVRENDSEGYAVWAVKAIPAADVRENKRGHWTLKHIGNGHLWECSICRKEELKATEYCPNCGADMREDQT